MGVVVCLLLDCVPIVFSAVGAPVSFTDRRLGADACNGQAGRF